MLTMICTFPAQKKTHNQAQFIGSQNGLGSPKLCFSYDRINSTYICRTKDICSIIQRKMYFELGIKDIEKLAVTKLGIEKVVSLS